MRATCAVDYAELVKVYAPVRTESGLRWELVEWHYEACARLCSKCGRLIPEDVVGKHSLRRRYVLACGHTRGVFEEDVPHCVCTSPLPQDARVIGPHYFEPESLRRDWRGSNSFCTRTRVVGR